MKRFVLLLFLTVICEAVFAQNEIGPEGKNLVWFLLALPLIGIIYVIFRRKGGNTTTGDKGFFRIRRVKLELEKDRLYYPDYLTLTVKNNGNTDVDLDRPLMIFDNFWLKRRFRLNGMDNRLFYPLYLERGKIHTLNVDLYRFYRHDKRLKKFPKVKIVVSDVKGRRLASKAVYLRKTLFKF